MLHEGKTLGYAAGFCCKEIACVICEAIRTVRSMSFCVLGRRECSILEVGSWSSELMFLSRQTAELCLNCRAAVVLCLNISFTVFSKTSFQNKY